MRRQIASAGRGASGGWHARTALAGTALTIACGASVRTAPVGPHSATAVPPVVVDLPPPVNKVETIPNDPGTPCAWLDGRWEWVDRTWAWTPGTWLVPPHGCHFATPETVWVPSADRGLLFYLAGRWYPDSGTTACEPARSCGSTPPGAP